MEKRQIAYRVVETSCFPNAWKVEAIGCRCDNSTSNYFQTREEAIREAEKRERKNISVS